MTEENTSGQGDRTRAAELRDKANSPFMAPETARELIEEADKLDTRADAIDEGRVHLYDAKVEEVLGAPPVPPVAEYKTAPPAPEPPPLKVVDMTALKAEIRAVNDAIIIAKKGCRASRRDIVGDACDMADAEWARNKTRQIKHQRHALWEEKIARAAISWRERMPGNQRDLHFLRKMMTELLELLAYLKGKTHQQRFLPVPGSIASEEVTGGLHRAQHDFIAPVIERFLVDVENGIPSEVDAHHMVYDVPPVAVRPLGRW